MNQNALFFPWKAEENNAHIHRLDAVEFLGIQMNKKIKEYIENIMATAINDLTLSEAD